jgi:Lon protease-like protein
VVSERIIPLFPLQVVLLPGMGLPLHIFEEKYKNLVEECLQKDREFGVVYHSGEKILRVGCTAGITEVIRNYNHGEMDILTEGRRRFRIREILDGKLYIEAKVEFFRDARAKVDERMRDLIRRGKESLEQLNSVGSRKTALTWAADIDPESLSFLIASVEGFSLEEKQDFLEMRSTALRLEKCVGSLDKIIERLKLSREIKRLFGTRDEFPDNTPM